MSGAAEKSHPAHLPAQSLRLDLVLQRKRLRGAVLFCTLEAFFWRRCRKRRWCWRPQRAWTVHVTAVSLPRLCGGCTKTFETLGRGFGVSFREAVAAFSPPNRNSTSKNFKLNLRKWSACKHSIGQGHLHVDLGPFPAAALVT